MNDDDILVRFNDQFWFDHNWSFGLHRHCLLTLPYQFDYFYGLYEAFNSFKSK